MTIESIKAKILHEVKKINELAIYLSLNTPHHVFIEWSGHVSQFSIRVHVGGWKIEEEPDLKIDTYLNSCDIIDRIDFKMETWDEKLQKIKNVRLYLENLKKK